MVSINSRYFMLLQSRMRRGGLLFLYGGILAALFLMAPTFAGAQRLPSSVIVRLAPGVTVKSAGELLRSSDLGAGLTIRPVVTHAPAGRATLAASRLGRYLVIEKGDVSTARLLAELGRSPIVEEAFENHRYRIDAAPNDSLYSEQWALSKVEAEKAWERTLGDSSITIGVLDTGIDFNHPDLAGAFAINAAEDVNRSGVFEPWPVGETRGGKRGDLDGIDQDGNGYADDLLGYDFVDQSVQNAGDWSGRDAIPADELGHGTNVGGVIAARRDNRIGVSGLAPGCRIVALRAFDVGGNGEDDDIAAALIYGVDRGLKVINLSFGDYYYSPLLRDAVRYAHEKGVTIVASSGNEGGTSPHYPSSFPEVISVGSTDQNDFLSSFTTYGGQLSLCAPGNDIMTTDLDSAYKEVSGTSFSAPMVSAAAGLLISLHPTWSPDEIRTVLELSSDDRGRAGWDLNYGAGRLNARRALSFPGPAAVVIASPEGDSGLRGDAMHDVIGSAFSPILESWQLTIGEGDEPKEWTELTSLDEHGRVLERLGAIRASDYGSGLHTLRLRIRQTNGRETERRVRLFLNQTKPVVEHHALHNVWRYAERALGLTVTTDQLTLLTAWVRRADDPSEPYRAASLEPIRTGWVRDHYLFLTGPEIEPGVPYNLYVVMRNAGGDTAMIGSPTSPIEIVRDRDAFSLTTLLPKPYALPYGYALNQTVQLFNDGSPSLALNRFTAGSYGKLMLYSFNGKSFVARDSIDESWIPRGFGDSDGNGLRELLVQASGAGAIFEQEGPNGRLFARTVYADTTSGDFWADGLHDFDGDGKDEVIARTDNARRDPGYYFIARRDGDKLTTIATLPNRTAPAEGDDRNKYGPPDAQVADFNGDGRPDILIGDDDGDFMIYQRTASGTFEELWSDENDGEGGSEYLAAGDLTGDGRAEAIVAYHARTGENFQHEYEPPFWTVKVFTFASDGTATLLWRDSIAYVRPTLPFLFFGGISTGNLDRRGGDELALSFFPSLYVFTWDSTARTMRPFWFREGTLSNKPIIADFDRDGLNEIGVGDGELIEFHQLNATFPGPPAPSGFRGWALNDSSAYLEWNAVPNVDYYTLYRAVGIPGDDRLRFDSVARTTSTSIVDTGFRFAEARLEPGRFYYYIVTSRNLALAPDDSLLSHAVILFTHNPARPLEATSTSARAIRVRMSFRVRDKLYEPGAIEVMGASDGRIRPVSTIVSADRESLLITLHDDSPEDSLIVRPTFLFRDFYDTPGDSTAIATVVMQRLEAAGERFIATRATLPARDTIAIDFDADVDPATAETIANYTLDPGGTIISARVDPENPRRVLLVLNGDYPIGALGRIYTVTIMNVRSADGRVINDGAGSVVGFTITEGDLAKVFVYPHPFSIARDAVVTFAGLTRRAQVRVFTQTGRLIKTIDSREGNGGVEWNGEDDRGEKVPPGIYIYLVSGTTADGSSYESEPQKIAIVP